MRWGLLGSGPYWLRRSQDKKCIKFYAQVVEQTQALSDEEKGDQITAGLNKASRRKPAEEMGGESADKPDEGRILCIIQVKLLSLERA